MRVWFWLTPAFLLLSGCSFHLSQVRAQVRDWPGGEGQVAFANGQTRLAESRIDNVGRFTLPLPQPEALAGVLKGSLPLDVPANCRSTVKASNPAARFYALEEIDALPVSGAALKLVSQTRSSAESQPQRTDQRLFVYASAPSRVQGQLTCPASQARYSLNLKAGWNRAVRRTTLEAGQMSRRIEDVGGEGFEGWEVEGK